MNELPQIAVIKGALTDPDRVYWKDHALSCLRERAIRVDDIIDALSNGQVIEEYCTDKPFPSVLVNGRTRSGRPMHVAVGVNEQAGEIHIVTGYEPDPLKWNENFSVRI
jgi:hypothetical protein